MSDLTAEELATVAAWAEANSDSNLIAAAYWALMDAMNGIEKATEAVDTETNETHSQVPSTDTPLISVDVIAAGGALEELEEAWFDAREVLGRRCLAEATTEKYIKARWREVAQSNMVVMG